jgi:hypothetical protein
LLEAPLICGDLGAFPRPPTFVILRTRTLALLLLLELNLTHLEYKTSRLRIFSPFFSRGVLRHFGVANCNPTWDFCRLLRFLRVASFDERLFPHLVELVLICSSPPSLLSLLNPISGSRLLFFLSRNLLGLFVAGILCSASLLEPDLQLALHWQLRCRACYFFYQQLTQ